MAKRVAAVVWNRSLRVDLKIEYTRCIYIDSIQSGPQVTSRKVFVPEIRGGQHSPLIFHAVNDDVLLFLFDVARKSKSIQNGFQKNILIISTLKRRRPRFLPTADRLSLWQHNRKKIKWNEKDKLNLFSDFFVWYKFYFSKRKWGTSSFSARKTQLRKY